MSKSIRRVRVGGVAFYLNQTSPGANKGGARFQLHRTSAHGTQKDGRVQLNAVTGKGLAAIASDQAFFEACQACFANKTVRAYTPRHQIRGSAGRWEGEAFSPRQIGEVAAQ